MTTLRDYLLAHVPTLAVERSPLWDRDPPLPAVAETIEHEAATLGLRGIAAVVGAVEARGVVLPGIDAPHHTAADARRSLPHVLRAALNGLDDLESDARGAHQAAGHGHANVGALHRTTRDSCRALSFELHAAARLAGIPIAPKDPSP